jgi:hypothetical protein
MAPSKGETTALLRPTPPPDGTGDAATASPATARKAFESADVVASRQYHDSRPDGGTVGDEAWHQSEGGLLKPVIFGGLDGILTSFAIVAGATGGGLSPTVVLVLGFSNIFADALR